MNTNTMKQQWNLRAKKDAFYYVESEFWNGNLDNFFKLGEERAQLLIDPVMAKLNPAASESSVLEIGCGVGRFSRALAKRFKSTIAVDVSEDMINQAKEQHPPSDYPSLQFRSTDGKSVSFVEKESMDFVFSYEVFQHMPSEEVILSNLVDVRRVIKSTGKALIHFRTEPLLSLNTIKTGIKKILPESVWQSFGFKPLTFDPTWTGTPLSINKIKQLCQSANLEILELIEDPTHSPGERIFVLLKPF